MNTTPTVTPTYAIDRRTVGYANNDGRYVAQRVAPAVWLYGGTLYTVGHSRFLGVFDTRADADAAIAADAAVWLDEDKPVTRV
jgi:hypothetical protein